MALCVNGWTSCEQEQNCAGTHAFGEALHGRFYVIQRSLRWLSIELNNQLPDSWLVASQQGSVKHVNREELEDRDKQRPSTFPEITLKQTDSGV